MKISDCMKALVIVGILGAPATACAETGTSQSTGQYIDDSVISNKIRAKLADDSELNVFEIDVTTQNGVVQLSGVVNNEAAKSRAGSVVSTVDGVKNVRNNLVVKRN